MQTSLFPYTFRIMLGAVATALLPACQSASDSKSSADQSTPTEQAANQAAPADSGTPGAWYRQYRGVLPGASTDSITLHLQVWPRQADDPETPGLAASWVDAHGHPYLLTGRISPSVSPDSITLTDYTLEHAQPGHPDPTWRLVLRGKELVGTVEGQPVRLYQRQVPGSVQLAAYYFSDSLAAFPRQPRSPYSRQHLLALLPIGGVASTVQATLQENLLRGLRGDTLDSGPVPQLAALWKESVRREHQNYREAAASSGLSATDTTGYTDFRFRLNYNAQELMQVIANEAPLLSIGYFQYAYQGGAHGSYGTNVATFDTRTGRRLRFTDIFRAGTDEQLVPVLNRAARQLLHLRPTAPLDGPLFVKQMPVTHNVFLTSAGVTFVYTPYEIASYAQGEIRLFVPLTQVQGLLKPDLSVGKAR